MIRDITISAKGVGDEVPARSLLLALTAAVDDDQDGGTARG